MIFERRSKGPKYDFLPILHDYRHIYIHTYIHTCLCRAISTYVDTYIHAYIKNVFLEVSYSIKAQANQRECFCLSMHHGLLVNVHAKASTAVRQKILVHKRRFPEPFSKK